jgi:hypothetical protein
VQRYPVRTTHRAQLRPEVLAQLCTTHFGRAERDGTAVSTSFGAIAALKVWGDGKDLAVEVTMNPKVDNTLAAETIQRYNLFLLGATGYSAKERASKLRKSATKGSPKE